MQSQDWKDIKKPDFVPDAIMEQYIKFGKNSEEIKQMIAQYIQKFDKENDGKFSFHDAAYIAVQEQHVYKHILEKCTHKIWIRDSPQPGFYFINDIGSQICSTAEHIETIQNNCFLSPYFKKKHLRIIKIEPSIFNAYISLMQEPDDTIEKRNCVEKMIIMKNIANAIHSCGNLDFAALTLYSSATKQLGMDPTRKHARCQINKEEKHDILLSKLYNNISTIHYKNSQYECSKFNALKALELNPNYGKCIKRLNVINNKNNDTLA